ncbi:integrase family protein [Ruegeria sediminis]|uniref:Integrase family protein n=1 Tax=Ruegeria sediminis TaxID=2583820 RepID=A0ABY2WVU4_9RHOB|nr:integrase family protein [Ruegeria sediminis]TMV06426.1 integrase family protein [Ruegeria sediminis]
MPRQTAIPLTLRTIETEARRIEAGKTVLRDSRAPGLMVTISPTNVLFRHQYKLKNPLTGKWGNTKSITLGRYPEMSLDEARDEMRRVRKMLDAGQDPALEREAEKAVNQTAVHSRLVSDAIDRFVDERSGDWTTATTHTFLNEFALIRANLGHLPMGSVTRPQLQAVIDDYLGAKRREGRDGRSRAIRIAQLLTALWRQASVGTPSSKGWGWMLGYEVARDLTIEGRNRMKSRNRVLSQTEVRDMWPQWEAMGPSGRIFQLSLITGLRIGALCRVEFSHLGLDPVATVGAVDDGPRIVIPAADGRKATARSRRDARDLHLPLSPFAVDVWKAAIAERNTRYTDCPFVFVGHKGNHFAPNSCNQRWREVAPPDATPHDLRRTMRTWLGETMHPGGWHDEEMLIGHSVGNAVSGAYDHARRLARLRPITDAYATRLRSLLFGAGADVMSLEVRAND